MQRDWIQVAIIGLFLVAGMLSPMAHTDTAVTGGILAVATLNAPGLLKWSGEDVQLAPRIVIIAMFLIAGLVSFRIGCLARELAGGLVTVAVAGGMALLVALAAPPKKDVKP